MWHYNNSINPTGSRPSEKRRAGGLSQPLCFKYLGGKMPNGKPGDNPLSDFIIHGAHPFPHEIEEMLLRIDKLGRKKGRYPLGENWPYSPREFDWEQGQDIDGALKDLSFLIKMLAEGRGDEVLLNPLTGKPFIESK